MSKSSEKIEEPQPEKLIEKYDFSYEETGKEKELRTLEKESSEELDGGMNKTIFVKLKDDGSGVFKPRAGEKNCSRKNIREGTYYKRERAAYLVDRFLELGLVPPTVIREIDGEVGSFQEFVDDAEFPRGTNNESKTELIKLWVFDYILWSADRKFANLLFTEKGKKVHAIDNAYSFGDERTKFYGEFLGEPIPSEIKEKLNQFSSSKDKAEILKDLLGELLSEEEINACFNRIKTIVKLTNEKGMIDNKLDFNGELIKK